MDQKNAFVASFVRGENVHSLYSFIPKRTRSSWISKLKTRGTLVAIKPEGRAKKYSNTDIQNLRAIVKANARLTIEEVIYASGIPAHHQTAVKALKSVGILSLQAVKVPFLTPGHAKTRLDWANRHGPKDVAEWKLWTFSDESTVEIHTRKGKTRFLIERAERYLPQYVDGAVQGGGGKLMIWSYISYDKGIGPLVFVPDGMDAAKYKKLLAKHVLNHMLDQINPLDSSVVPMYQDDGASSHDSHLVVDYCASVGIQRPFWPAKSPDMNPIEYVWGWVKDRLSRLDHQPSNIEELKRDIELIWRSITHFEIMNLYEGMPARIQSLKDANGWNTKH